MIEVEVCYATADGATRIAVTLPDGATVEDAVRESGIVALLDLDVPRLTFAVFGRPATGGTVLDDGDRVELLRPLLVAPKAARHRRVAKKDALRHPAAPGKAPR